MISDETVERVRDAANIVEIIGEHTKLTRRGGDYRGPCPFHMGKNPNFSVSVKTSTYHCFKCGVSGDVFTFVREKMGLDWPDAVKYVGERSGVEVIDTPRKHQPADPNEKNWEVLATAAEWFRAQLSDDTVGRDARNYLTQNRGMDAAAIARFGIGFAPRDTTLLRKYLHSLGFDDARLIEAGLFKISDRNNEPYPQFRGRVMFPIVDELGHHVAFGGRAMGDDQPKYLNSAESAVFQKRRTLYGLNWGKHSMRRSQRAIVVEGYMDAIRLALAGVEEVVAPLGTALTEEQASLIMRYAQNVYLLYDSDQAGQEATFRSAHELLRHKARVFVVSLPQDVASEKADPDTFVRRHGRSGLEVQLTNALDVFDRQVQIVQRKGLFESNKGRRLAIDKLLETIRAAADPVARDMYLAKLAEVTKLEKSTLIAEAEAQEKSLRGRSGQRSTSTQNGGIDPRNEDAPHHAADHGHDARSNQVSDELGSSLPSDAQGFRRPWKGRGGKPSAPEWRASMAPLRRRTSEPAERALVSAMLFDRGLAESIAERHGPGDFRDAHFQHIFQALLTVGVDASIEEVADALDPESLSVLRDMLEREESMTPEAVDVRLNLAKLDARILEDRLDEIRREIGQAGPEQQRELAREQIELSTELRRLLPIRSPRGKPKH